MLNTEKHGSKCLSPFFSSWIENESEIDAWSTASSSSKFNSIDLDMMRPHVNDESISFFFDDPSCLWSEKILFFSFDLIIRSNEEWWFLARKNDLEQVDSSSFHGN